MLTVTLPDSTARAVKRWAEVQAQLNEADDDRSRALLRALLEVLSKQVVGTLQAALVAEEPTPAEEAAYWQEYGSVMRAIGQLADQVSAAGERLIAALEGNHEPRREQAP